MIGRQDEGILGAGREADHDGPLDAQAVEDVERILQVLMSVEAVGVGRAIGSAVAARVERDDAVVARQEGDLHLPVAAVDEHPCRQEEDRRLALAV